MRQRIVLREYISTGWYNQWRARIQQSTGTLGVFLNCVTQSDKENTGKVFRQTQTRKKERELKENN